MRFPTFTDVFEITNLFEDMVSKAWKKYFVLIMYDSTTYNEYIWLAFRNRSVGHWEELTASKKNSLKHRTYYLKHCKALFIFTNHFWCGDSSQGWYPLVLFCVVKLWVSLLNIVLFFKYLQRGFDCATCVLTW